MPACIDQTITDEFSVLHGDCCELIQELPDESIDLTGFSPPFASLYTYSDSERDMGNCGSDAEFWTHFNYLIHELFRVTKPGCVVAFHCMNIPSMKERDGVIGLKDFRGDMIRAFQSAGFIFHSEHVIWKDPLIEATRTKAIGLMHKQLCKDSSMCRSGIPDYLIAMRKPGDRVVPVSHDAGMDHWAGDDPPREGNLSHERWRRVASPVWMDIRQSNTLQYRIARDNDDERHICPLQLDVIERFMWLWSNPGETFLSPFAGIGSELYTAIKMGRKAIGFELKDSYYPICVRHCHQAVGENRQQTLFG